MQKIKKGDTVVMRSGANRGKSGKVLAVFPTTSRVVVEGLNLVRKHRKPRRPGEKGQKIEYPRSVPFGTVMLRCSACKAATRVGFRLEAGGKKQRVCKKCDALIP